MDAQEVLQNTDFGQRVAEEESSELESYFVETDQWAQIYNGDVDIIYGPKGSGKSALYSLLVRRADELFDRSIVILSAEKPRGTPAFSDLKRDPPTSEAEFVGIWKLYLLILIDSVLQQYEVESTPAKLVRSELAQAGLVEQNATLSRLVNKCVNYVKSFFRPPRQAGIEMTIDPATWQPTISGNIVFSESQAEANDSKSVDFLLGQASEALSQTEFRIWVLMDRLDVAFADSPELEANALKALFRTYLDMAGMEGLSLKIFLRTDIWKRITESGFREASHITRHITIKWDGNSLINLVTRRILKNSPVRERYRVVSEEVLSSLEEQFELFYRLFPKQVDVGPNKPKTFDWILSRTRDGTQDPAPREIIHFLNAARAAQLRQFEIGTPHEGGEELFTRSALREALPEVSRTRLEQTLFAEYPNLRPYVERLAGEKTNQGPASLATIWNVGESEARSIADELVEVGFFERRGTNSEPKYWVPFLYRDATEMVQGTADPS